MWARYGIEKFGVPKEIILFEYDTARIAEKWKPMITWSKKQFLEEVVTDPSSIMLGRFKEKELLPNSLKNRVNLKSILEPIMQLKKYPDGFIVCHEETSSLAQKYNIPTRYIYAINIQMMETLIKLYEKQGTVHASDLILGDNTEHALDGSDNIGMLLEYSDKKVYYFNTIPNISVVGTNATYTQVVYGVLAALFTLVFDNLKPGTYFVEDLYDTHYKNFLFDNMRVKEYIFKKRLNKLKLVKYAPEIKVKKMNNFKSFYMD